MIPPADPDDLAFAVEVATDAGAVTLEHFRSTGLRVDRKDDGTPVTAADLAAERLVRRRLAHDHPTDGIIGEEHGDHDGATDRT